MPLSVVHNEETRNSYKVVSVKGKQVREHRLIMQQHLGRPLLSNEIVHHIDENKQNNELSNLILTTRHDHILIHQKDWIRELSGETLHCCVCGQGKYYCHSTLKTLGNRSNYKCLKCFKKTSKKSKIKHHRKVECVDGLGNRIGVYKNATEASQALKIGRTSIKNCLNGYSKTCGGFTFKHIEI